jgi:hypothetical protein
MPRLREFVRGPWRAVAVLGVTQILAWGTLFYPFWSALSSAPRGEM